jgi:phosphatidylglycerophosphatase A
MRRHLALFYATGCYVGLIPGIAGTYGSVLATLCFYLVCRISNSIILPELHLSAVCLISLLGVLAAARVAKDRGDEDPHIVVIDEVAGQLLTFVFLPVSGFNLILGTLVFRVFDIWKPYPIRKLEQLRNGVGIMADDLLAGVYANIVMQLVRLLQ